MSRVLTLLLAAAAVAAVAAGQCGPGEILRPLGGGRISCSNGTRVLVLDASGGVTIPGTLTAGAINFTVPWTILSGVPSTFNPRSHSPSHTVGSDKITPSGIGAMASVAGSGVVKVASGAPGLVTGAATDCVKVDGSSGTCGTGGGGVAFDPFDSSLFQMVEEFTCSTNSNWFGTHSWLNTTISSGSAFGCVYAPPANKFISAIRGGSTAATVGSGASLSAPSAAWQNIGNGATGGFDSWIVEWHFRMDNAAIANHGARVGLSTAYNTISPAEFAGLRWIGGTDATYLQFEVVSGGSQIAQQATTITANTQQLYRFRLSNPGNGTLVFTLTNTSDAACPGACPSYSWTHSGTVPGAVWMFPYAANWQTAGSTATMLYLDRFAMEVRGLQR